MARRYLSLLGVASAMSITIISEEGETSAVAQPGVAVSTLSATDFPEKASPLSVCTQQQHYVECDEVNGPFWADGACWDHSGHSSDFDILCIEHGACEELEIKVNGKCHKCGDVYRGPDPVVLMQQWCDDSQFCAEGNAAYPPPAGYVEVFDDLQNDMGCGFTGISPLMITVTSRQTSLGPNEHYHPSVHDCCDCVRKFCPSSTMPTLPIEDPIPDGVCEDTDLSLEDDVPYNSCAEYVRDVGCSNLEDPTRFRCMRTCDICPEECEDMDLSLMTEAPFANCEEAAAKGACATKEGQFACKFTCKACGKITPDDRDDSKDDELFDCSEHSPPADYECDRTLEYQKICCGGGKVIRMGGLLQALVNKEPEACYDDDYKTDDDPRCEYINNLWWCCGETAFVTDEDTCPCKTEEPTAEPTTQPTGVPSPSPTTTPTGVPSSEPTSIPTGTPSSQPTSEPSASPTGTPTQEPTIEPTGSPVSVPGSTTESPTRRTTDAPTSKPTTKPTDSPTSMPTNPLTPAPSCPSVAAAPTHRPTEMRGHPTNGIYPCTCENPKVAFWYASPDEARLLLNNDQAVLADMRMRCQCPGACPGIGEQGWIHWFYSQTTGWTYRVTGVDSSDSDDDDMSVWIALFITSFVLLLLFCCLVFCCLFAAAKGDEGEESEEWNPADDEESSEKNAAKTPGLDPPHISPIASPMSEQGPVVDLRPKPLLSTQV